MTTAANENEGPVNSFDSSSQERRAPADDYQAAIQRAEELVDQFTERVGPYASQAKRQLREFAARMREEAEDLWAEAQHIRKRNQA